MAPQEQTAVITPLPSLVENGETSKSRVEEPQAAKTKPRTMSLLPNPKIPLDPAKLLAKGTVELKDWGFPGFLTKDEFAILVQFREEVFFKQDEEFRKAIFSFGFEEEESHALCRWLRARKFDLQKVIHMVQEAVAQRAKPAESDFFPDPKDALGCEPSIYISQYPQLYTGHSLSGAPVFISKPGILNTDGVACVTNLDGILHYHWHAMIHDFAARLRAKRLDDPEGFKRFECICIMDLENLSVSKVGRDAMNIIKVQSSIDSICFPETLFKFIVINAPSTVGVLWNVIKGWIDPRTAAKVEIYGSRRKRWEKRLTELIDPYELPKDYGGKAEDTSVTLVKDNKEDGVVRQYTEVLVVKGSASTPTYELDEGETMEISVFTRSLTEASFSIQKATTTVGKPSSIQSIPVQHKGKGLEEEPPTVVPFPRFVRGPIKFKVKAECKSGSFSSCIFLVVGKVVNRAFVRKSMMQKGMLNGEPLVQTPSLIKVSSTTKAARRPSMGDETIDSSHQLSTADKVIQRDSVAVATPRFVTPPPAQCPLEESPDSVASHTPEPFSQSHYHSYQQHTLSHHSETSSGNALEMNWAQIIGLAIVALVVVAVHDYWLLWLLKSHRGGSCSR